MRSARRSTCSSRKYSSRQASVWPSVPEDAENVIDLIRNADAAMYYSKQNGGNSFAFYSREMNAAAVERLMLKSKLRRALSATSW
mgnify:CR=1 FL=1